MAYATLAVVSLAVLYLAAEWNALRRNLAAAKRSGLPYLVVPLFVQDIAWLFTFNVLVPLLDLLPPAATRKWLPFLVYHRTWNQGYVPFRQAGKDTFVAVSSARNIVWTSDPDLIRHVLQYRETFEKPLEAYDILNLYGPTVAGTTGPQWQRIRKLLVPSFNEKTHREVWNIALKLADAMIESWVANRPSGIISDINEDTSRFAFNVLVTACFNRELPWAVERGAHKALPDGHKRTLSGSFAAMLDHLRSLYLINPSVLALSPLSTHKLALEAHDEWLRYMEEMCRDERSRHDGQSSDNPGVLEAILGLGKRSKASSQLSHGEVLGNIHVMILAGHETTGTTMAFALLLLACFPDIQKKMQANLDEVFAGGSPAEWSYQTDLAPILDGYVGAVIKETLRLYIPIPYLMRTTPKVPLPVKIRDKQYIIPEGSLMFLNLTAAQRNPNYWPEPKMSTQRSEMRADPERPPYIFSAFNPERWIDSASQVTEDAFFPFASGPRSCIGRRFTTVELAILLARIFTEYSIELAVDDDAVYGLESQDVRRQAWQEARRKAEAEMTDGIKFIVTVKMTGKVPLRLVKRGEEAFFDVQ